jgi:adenine-specific DNA methylase
MTLKALVTLIFVAAYAPAFAQQAQQCDAAAFREAVAAASASIKAIHEKNSKIFQEDMQKLRAINKWQDTEFVIHATPFVQDETTATFDTVNQALISKVQTLDSANAATESGRCAMLTELKASMEKVVANTAAKWDHMLAKIERATAQPLQAGFAQ